MLPTDGIVKATALKATQGANNDADKVRAIYDWVVANAWREPKVRGCGEGDIKTMLETGNLGGKCADINALFVGLCRSVGVPARDVYGLRLAPSAFGYKELSGNSSGLQGAQHCRAEVHLSAYGWVPVDPADVRKVILEEPPANRPLDDEMVKLVRARLFGSWEMNWMAYNYGHDIVLPKSALGNKGKVNFLMYPQGETKDGRLDSLDPTNFTYKISSKLIA
jgi:transglutaminase-like putative cysteine protease